jgi:hypothetical protein
MSSWPGSETVPVKDGRLRTALNDSLSTGTSVHYAIVDLLVGGIWKGFAVQTLTRLDEKLARLQEATSALQFEVAQAMVTAAERDAEHDADRQAEAA